MKILLAVDGSAYTKKMLAYLAEHSDQFGASNQYTLLNVQTPLPSRARAAVGAEIVQGYYDDEAAKVINPVTRLLKRAGIEANVITKVGRAGELIARTADSGKFDMIVMGSRGHGALGNLVMGSVATQVVAQSKTPVLLVR